MQKIITENGTYDCIYDILQLEKCKNIFLVTGASFQYLKVKDYIDSMDVSVIKFSSFSSNPLYEEVCKGVEAFKTNKCDAIIAIGGGSAIDVAKCIKLYCNMDSKFSYLDQEYIDNFVPLIAMPTTAGTGSESTHFAVIYYKGMKQSIMHNSILPKYVILDSSVLHSLPLYQKKCTMLDAFCQAIESWWSVNSNEESISYSKIAIEKIIHNWHSYIFGDSTVCAKEIMIAANYAGQAINIAQTTAAHAFSYKLTSLYKLPHGHAVAISLPEIWSYMLKNIHLCNDPRGENYVRTIFIHIANALECIDVDSAITQIKNMLNTMGLRKPIATNRTLELKLLTDSVNSLRLKNNPIFLESKSIYNIYNLLLE